MGVLLAIPLFAACWLVPPFLIFRSTHVSGGDKGLWIGTCLLSPLIPVLVIALGIAAAVHLGGYQRDLKAVAMGPEAMVMAVGNLLALAIP